MFHDTADFLFCEESMVLYLFQQDKPGVVVEVVSRCIEMFIEGKASFLVQVISVGVEP